MNFNKEILIIESLNNIKYEFVKNLSQMFNINNFKLKSKLSDFFIHYMFDILADGKFNIDKFVIKYDDIKFFSNTYEVLLPEESEVLRLQSFLISKFKTNMRRTKTYIINKQTKPDITGNIKITYDVLPEIYGLNIFKFSLKRFSEISTKYIGDRYLFDKYMSLMILRYSMLGTENQHLSIPPIILKELTVDVELFGSPLNTTAKNFCSPFYDVEKYFGSLGNFFTYQLQSNKTYTFNPPYVEEFMNLAAKRLLNQVDLIKDFIVIINIPVWDTKSQKQYDLKDYGLEFEAYDMFMKSKFLHSSTVCFKDECKYYNYLTEKFIPIISTHSIILTDKKISFSADDYKKLWKRSVK